MRANCFVSCVIGLAGVATMVCAGPPVSASEVNGRLIGTWVGVSGHWGKENPPPENRSFTFATNHKCVVTIGRETMAGTYRINVSNEPFRIDFTFDVNDKVVTTLTIFDFPREGLLRVAEWDPDRRRRTFEPGITFRKKDPQEVRDK